AAQNNIFVKGKITNANGDPLPGVSIVVKGSTRGVSSNAKGDFEINAPANGTLTISSIGFASREVKVNNQTSLSVSLIATENQMEQVVVVGYGTQKKKDVTGSVVSVNETALREVPVSNLQGALQGRAAGLEVQTVGTTPGSGAQIRIRGTRSISGSNDPLLVLDGIPYSGGLNDINPDDVASVDILKDASATAIYGSRGANGVILVTTKRGKSGETHISFSSYYGIGTVAKKYPVYNPTEYIAMRNISPWSQGYMAEEKANMAAGKTTDWQDAMYENSYKTDHNLTVSGGSNGSTFSLGGGYYKETTVLPGQDFTRYSLRGTIDSKIGNRIKVGLNTLNSVGITNGSQFVFPMFPILSLSPYMTPYDSAGNLIKSPTGDNDDRQSQYNPLLLKSNNNQWVDRVRRLRTFNSVYGELEIIKGLKYRLNLGLSYAQEEDDQFRASDDPAGLVPSYFRPKQGNTAYINNGETWGYTVENILTYDKTIGKHRINFTGLYSAEEYHSH
ncbi:MAG TPA: SusC/RagA family TonB-linked outer membrane protein, partial [Hanamia sp.]